MPGDHVGQADDDQGLTRKENRALFAGFLPQKGIFCAFFAPKPFGAFCFLRRFLHKCPQAAAPQNCLRQVFFCPQFGNSLPYGKGDWNKNIYSRKQNHVFAATHEAGLSQYPVGHCSFPPRLRRLVHENLIALRFSVSIWFYNNQLRVRKPRFSESATQFGNPLPYRKGETAALK